MPERTVAVAAADSALIMDALGGGVVRKMGDLGRRRYVRGASAGSGVRGRLAGWRGAV